MCTWLNRQIAQGQARALRHCAIIANCLLKFWTKRHAWGKNYWWEFATFKWSSSGEIAQGWRDHRSNEERLNSESPRLVAELLIPALVGWSQGGLLILVLCVKPWRESSSGVITVLDAGFPASSPSSVSTLPLVVKSRIEGLIRGLSSWFWGSKL